MARGYIRSVIQDLYLLYFNPLPNGNVHTVPDWKSLQTAIKIVIRNRRWQSKPKWNFYWVAILMVNPLPNNNRILRVVADDMRNHCGKRRNCSNWAISPFPTMISGLVYIKPVKSWLRLVMGWIFPIWKKLQTTI